MRVPPWEFLRDDFVGRGGAVKRAMRPGGVLAVNVIAESPASISRLKVRRIHLKTFVYMFGIDLESFRCRVNNSRFIN
jgi:hypothetical protein